ncbi:hypothetical protein HDU96_003884 [Phlyctochytrium bullatum]|nr:hypothetical protein HDU96_003884 [Phlyctochytrium bullatum]
MEQISLAVFDHFNCQGLPWDYIYTHMEKHRYYKDRKMENDVTWTIKDPTTLMSTGLAPLAAARMATLASPVARAATAGSPPRQINALAAALAGIAAPTPTSPKVAAIGLPDPDHVAAPATTPAPAPTPKPAPRPEPTIVTAPVAEVSTPVPSSLTKPAGPRSPAEKHAATAGSRAPAATYLTAPAAAPVAAASSKPAPRRFTASAATKAATAPSATTRPAHGGLTPTPAEPTCTALAVTPRPVPQRLTAPAVAPTAQTRPRPVRADGQAAAPTVREPSLAPSLVSIAPNPPVPATRNSTPCVPIFAAAAELRPATPPPASLLMVKLLATTGGRLARRIHLLERAYEARQWHADDRLLQLVHREFVRRRRKERLVLPVVEGPPARGLRLGRKQGPERHGIFRPDVPLPKKKEVVVAASTDPVPPTSTPPCASPAEPREEHRLLQNVLTTTRSSNGTAGNQTQEPAAVADDRGSSKPESPMSRFVKSVSNFFMQVARVAVASTYRQDVEEQPYTLPGDHYHNHYRFHVILI